MSRKFGSLFKDLLSYGFIGVISKFIGVVAIPIYVKHLTVSEFGILDLFMSILTISALVGTFQLETSFLRFYTTLESEDQKIKYFSTGLNAIILLSLIFAPLFFLFVWIVFDDLSLPIVVLTTVLVPITSIFSYTTCVYRVKFDRKGFVKINLINIIGIPVFSIITVLLGFGVVGIIISTMTANLLALILVYRDVKLFYARKLDIKALREMFNYCFPLIPAGLSVSLQQNAPNIFIAAMIGTELLGFYSFAAKVFIPFKLIYQGLKMAWYPRAYQWYDSNEKIGEKFKQFEIIYSAGLTSICVLLLFFSEEVIQLLGDEKMIPAHDLVGFMGLVLLIRSNSYFYIVVQNILKHSKTILLINFLSFSVLGFGLLILNVQELITLKNVIIIEIIASFQFCKNITVNKPMSVSESLNKVKIALLNKFVIWVTS